MSEIESKPDLPTIGPGAARVLVGYVEVERATGVYATMEKVARHIGKKSAATVEYHLPTLIQRGLMHRHEHRKREWQATPLGIKWYETHHTEYKLNQN